MLHLQLDLSCLRLISLDACSSKRQRNNLRHAIALEAERRENLQRVTHVAVPNERFESLRMPFDVFAIQFSNAKWLNGKIDKTSSQSQLQSNLHKSHSLFRVLCQSPILFQSLKGDGGGDTSSDLD